MVAKLGALPNALASSFNVSSAPGDESTSAAIATCTKAVVASWVELLPADAVGAFGVLNDGNNYQGIVESLTLPKFGRKFEKYRGGGMLGSADVDLGLDDGALDTEFSIGGTELLLFKQMGKATVDGIQLRFTGSIQRDDTGEVQAVELVVRGRHKEVDSGEWKTGESNTTKVSSTNSYANGRLRTHDFRSAVGFLRVKIEHSAFLADYFF